jgi:F-type H+/Na+-transporting ATPase subunit alpha
MQVDVTNFERYLTDHGEIGFVEQVIHSIARVSGLPTAKPMELVVFESGELGQVLNLDHNFVEVLVFGKKTMPIGTRVAKTGNPVQVPVGDELMGQMIDPLGYSIDQTKPAKKPKEFRPLERLAGGIMTRKNIDEPLETGTSMVDMVIPLGIGQRELVIGDRKTGKTTFLLRAMYNQIQYDTICIYAAIGKKQLDIKSVEAFLNEHKIMDKCIIVASTSQDPAGIIYQTPYAAMTIAEYFCDKGKRVLLVLDDLLIHAKFYRELSLLGRRFPGRNSYPGDIFYAHARLLERAGNYTTADGKGASITCLAVCETTQGDLSGYIQTNLMSMTDGHIFFDGELFSKGRRPAINPFVSVTRVGRQTQSTLRREINREMTSFLTLYDKVESFAHFSQEASTTVKKTLSTGEKILAFFDQTTVGTFSIPLQIFLFCMLWNGAWDNYSAPEMMVDMKRIIERYRNEPAFKKYVDDMIAGAKKFNPLLNTIKMIQAQVVTPRAAPVEAATAQKTVSLDQVLTNPAGPQANGQPANGQAQPAAAPTPAQAPNGQTPQQKT